MTEQKTLTTADVPALVEKVVAICEKCGREIVHDGREHVCQIWEVSIDKSGAHPWPYRVVVDAERTSNGLFLFWESEE